MKRNMYDDIYLWRKMSLCNIQDKKSLDARPENVCRIGMYELESTKVEKGSPQKTNSLTINMSREFVLTATTVSPFCTTFPAIAESPLSKRHLWSTPYRMDRVPRRSRSLGRGEKSAQTQLTSGIHRELWYSSSTRNGFRGRLSSALSFS